MFLVLVLTTILVWLIVRQYQKVSRLPPGPLAIPLLGNLPQIFFYFWKTGGIVPTLDLFRKKYGNVFTLWLGPVPHVSIADFETSHEVFVKNANKYAEKFTPPIFHEARNPSFLEQSRNMGVGKDLMEMRIMEELNARCADIDKSAVDGVTIKRTSELFDLTVGSIINSILVGKRFEENTKGEFLQIKKSMDDAMEVFSPFDMTAPVWFLKTFFRRRYDIQMNTQEKSKDFVAREVLERLEKIKRGEYTVDEENLQDYSDAFILKMQQEKLRDGSNRHFSVENLKTMLIDLWLTGQETTTTTLISGFNQLLLHPDVMEKARKELMKVTDNGKRSLSTADKNSTPYFNAVIGEIQRHASILNVSFWKVNHEFTYMGGHPVDAGALVTAQLSALHVNDTIFENPKVFNPERFIRNDKLLQQIIPFGVGKRNCLGEALARAELYLIFGNLLLRYNLKPHGKLSTEEYLPFSAAKRPFKLEMQFIKI